MSLAKELDKLKYDKRLLDWHVARGKLTSDQRKQHLDSLPDLASNVEEFSLGQEKEASISHSGANVGNHG